jgi:hypothetical protein
LIRTFFESPLFADVAGHHLLGPFFDWRLALDFSTFTSITVLVRIVWLLILTLKAIGFPVRVLGLITDDNTAFRFTAFIGSVLWLTTKIVSVVWCSHIVSSFWFCSKIISVFWFTRFTINDVTLVCLNTLSVRIRSLALRILKFSALIISSFRWTIFHLRTFASIATIHRIVRFSRLIIGIGRFALDALFNRALGLIASVLTVFLGQFIVRWRVILKLDCLWCLSSGR